MLQLQAFSVTLQWPRDILVPGDSSAGLFLLLALNILSPYGQKELDLQKAIHIFPPCQSNLKRAQTLRLAALVSGPLSSVSSWGFFKTQNLIEILFVVLMVSV